MSQPQPDPNKSGSSQFAWILSALLSLTLLYLGYVNREKFGETVESTIFLYSSGGLFLLVLIGWLSNTAQFVPVSAWALNTIIALTFWVFTLTLDELRIYHLWANIAVIFVLVSWSVLAFMNRGKQDTPGT